MGNDISCQHRRIEIKDVSDKIYTEDGVLNNMFGQREFQVANGHCNDCLADHRVIRYKNLGNWGGWSSWTEFDVTKCSHPDSCLVTLVEKPKQVTGSSGSSSNAILNTVMSAFNTGIKLANSAVTTVSGSGSNTASTATSTTADVQCSACEVIFKDAAKQFSHKHWDGQKVAVEAQWRINRDKLVTSANISSSNRASAGASSGSGESGWW